MESVAISGTARAEINKKSTKAARRAGLVPCVIYGGEKVVHFTSDAKSFKPLVYTGAFKLADITVDGSTHKCILKDLQFHPVTEELMHLDFIELVDGHPVKVEIPVQFKGAAPGVKTGGKLIQKVRKIKVKTTPDKLVDALFADISNLQLSQSVRVRDVELVEGMELMNPPGIPVASVEVPRALRSAASKAGEDGVGDAGAEEA